MNIIFVSFWETSEIHLARGMPNISVGREEFHFSAEERRVRNVTLVSHEYPLHRKHTESIGSAQQKRKTGPPVTLRWGRRDACLARSK